VKTTRLSMVTTNVSVARLQLGNGLLIQTVVTMYRIHVPNRRVSLIMKTSSIGTACIAAAAEVEKVFLSRFARRGARRREVC